MTENHWLQFLPYLPLRDEEKECLESNSFSDQMMHIFNHANIQYGRIDVGLKDGQIQVWEINTNPVLIGKKTKRECFFIDIDI